MKAARDLFRNSHLIVSAMLVFVIGAAITQPAKSQTVQEKIIGVHSLAQYRPHGDEPTGRISYDSAGRMWAMIFPPGRSSLTASSTAEDYRAAMRGVVAYYGTYDIDESTDRVIHHVQSASNPGWIGDDFIRWYRFEGPNLLISVSPGFDNPLLWERLPDN